MTTSLLTIIIIALAVLLGGIVFYQNNREQKESSNNLINTTTESSGSRMSDFEFRQIMGRMQLERDTQRGILYLVVLIVVALISVLLLVPNSFDFILTHGPIAIVFIFGVSAIIYALTQLGEWNSFCWLSGTAFVVGVMCLWIASKSLYQIYF